MGNDPYCTISQGEYGARAVSPMRRRVISNASTGDVESNSQGGPRKPEKEFVHFWKKFFVISCLAGFFIDPLFFFTLSVDQDYKCIFFSWTFAIGISAVRTVIDIVYLLHILIQFRLKYVVWKSRFIKHYKPEGFAVAKKKAAMHYFRGHFFLDFFVVLPLPQVIIFAVIPAHFGLLAANSAKHLLWTTVLVQNVPRIMKLYDVIARGSSSRFIFESVWSSFAVNLLMYVLGGHVVGSCWYLFGFQRVNDCLRAACSTSKITNCKMFLDCGHGPKYNKFTDKSNWESWKKNGNASSCLSKNGTFEYGIFKLAPEIAKQRHVIDRCIYSLFWGFQQISTLAGNQDPSFYVWEVLFTMGIIMLGLLLFAILIGNVQNFLQSLGRRRREMRLRRRDVKKLMSRLQLPKNLKSKVKEAEKNSWAAACAIHEEELLKSLPENLQCDIRRHRFKFIERVSIFSLMDKSILDAFRGKLRRELYTANSYVQKKGEPIDKMVFIVKGKLESTGADRNPSHLYEGDVCGEELLVWHLENASLKDGENIQGPMQTLFSNMDVRCLTIVETFILKFSDLVDVTINFERFLRNPRIQAAIRYNSTYWRTKAAKHIQVVWRYKRWRGPQSR